MEILFEILLTLAELLGELGLEIVCDVVLGTVKAIVGETLHPEHRRAQMMSAGWLILGAAMGGLSVLALPHRVSKAGSVRGLSLVISPMVAGLAMDWWGEHRRSGGHDTTSLATLWGGAAFAFGFALMRFLWAR